MNNNQDNSSHGGTRAGAGRKVGSKNKATAEIRALASEHGPAAIQTLVDIMQGEDTPAASRVAAAKEIIERAYGKSGNIISLVLEKPISDYSPEDAILEITTAAAKGDVAIEDAAKLTGLVESRIKAVEIADLNERLTELEREKS